MKIDIVVCKFIIVCFDLDWFDCKFLGWFSRVFNISVNII